MSQNTFECITFSKNMGEDSEGENSEEDFDEMIMNMDYFQKQNKSSEPSVMHDPLMLDHTTMNENTIMLIRNIEANLNNTKIIQESESEAGNNISHQCHDTVPASNKNTIELMKAQQIEQTKLNNNKLGIMSGSKVNLNVNESRKKLETRLPPVIDNTTKLQQKNRNGNSQQIIVIDDDDDDSQPVGVEIVHKRKKMKLNNSKSFWSPGGNPQISSSEGGTQIVSKKHDKHSKIPIEQNQNHAKEGNSQINSDIETSTTKLLRDVAKDIEQYKSRALPKLEKPLQSQNISSSVTQSTSQQVTKMKDSLTKKEGIESDKQKGINEKQKESSKKIDAETKISETITVKNNLGIKSKAIETLVKHQSGNKICQQQKKVHTENFCEICKRYFKVHAGLVSHRIAKHGYPKKLKSIICEDCHDAVYVEFSSKEELMRHRKEEHPEKICEICNWYFISVDVLTYHKKAIHGQ